MGAPYIYDISSLKVNNLTLILVTWRKWWAPNNASKWQMGFNSGFKGLMLHSFLFMTHLVVAPCNVIKTHCTYTQDVVLRPSRLMDRAFLENKVRHHCLA